MTHFRKMKSLLTVALILSLSFVFNACKEDEPEVFPVPTITAGSAVSGIAGTTVKVTATINAPGGLKSLQVLKNGQNFDTKTYPEGVLTDSYTKDYVIENLPANTPVNFTFLATDYQNQGSSPSNFTVTVTAVPAKQKVIVEGLLTGNITWTKDKIYVIRGFVRVGSDTLQATPANVSTGVLTIEAGTVIQGERATKGTLIIQRGSRIIANGTAAAPIVFTSERDPGLREAGDWGGLVICGRARNNQPGGSFQLEGSYKGWNGGTDDADNSGTLRYVRVEYAGVPINPNQEVNSFTFGSVGSGTTMEYLQASFGGDDAFEWFGGTANAKYLVAYRCLDDDFDVDFGHRGNVQFGVALRGATQADQSGSNGFEVDNDGQGTAAEPFTAATFSNISIIGAKKESATFVSTLFQNGMHLRRNCRIKIHNTFVTGFPNGIFVDGATTQANANTGELVLKNVVVAGVSGWGTNGYGQGASTQPQGFGVRDVNTATPVAAIKIGTQDPSVWFAAIAGNKILNSYTNTGINNNLFDAGRPTFIVNASATESIAKGGAAPAGAFFTAVDYIGAFKDADWTATWANFTPNTTDYSK